MWISPLELDRGRFKPNTNSKNSCSNFSETFVATEVVEVPFLCYGLGLKTRNIKKQKTKKTKTPRKIKLYHPQMIELAPERSQTWCGRQKSCLNCDFGFSPVYFFSPSKWDWSFYQVFCRKSIVPCHTSDECFLSSANPK